MVSIDPLDDDALTHYLLSNYCHLVTDEESNVLSALLWDAKSLNTESKLVQRKIGDLLERIQSADAEAVAKGTDHYRRTIRERLLRDHGSEITIVTCPQCKRLARTPLAKMCVLCGHSWHHS